jgi:hypothetical protein
MLGYWGKGIDGIYRIVKGSNLAIGVWRLR